MILLELLLSVARFPEILFFHVDDDDVHGVDLAFVNLREDRVPPAVEKNIKRTVRDFDNPFFITGVIVNNGYLQI